MIERKASRVCFEQGGFFSKKPPIMAKKTNVDWNEICRLQPSGSIQDTRLGTKRQDEEKSHGHLFNSDIFRNIALVIARYS